MDYTKKTTDYNEKFTSQLEGGNLGERVIAKWLETYKGFTTIAFGNNSEFDIKTEKEGRQVLLEIKTDRYEYFKKISTGNIFIETTCNGKLSGIHTTCADIFVYFFPDIEEAFFIKTKDLKELIKDPMLKRASLSGDKGKTTGILIKRNGDHRRFFNVEKIEKLSIWPK